MKRFWKRFVINFELVAYNRVLKDCYSMLSDEHIQNIHDAIKRTKQKLTN